MKNNYNMSYNIKMKYIFLIFSVIILCLPVQAKRLYAEKEYQNKWCNAHNGIQEYKLNDKARVDCLTDTYAVEFDFANKWAECIGQSQYYGLKTGRQAACVLIMENGEKDLRYLKRLRKVAYKKGIRTFTMKPENICNPAVKSNCPHIIKRE